MSYFSLLDLHQTDAIHAAERSGDIAGLGNVHVAHGRHSIADL